MSQPSNVTPWRMSPAVFLATGLGIGLVPWAPGTFGSLLGLPTTWALQQLPPWAEAVAIVALCLVGVPICTAAVRRIGRKDPGCVVFDEIVTMPITFFLVPMTNWKIALAGFLMHRLFDITKVPPAKQLERLPEGVGVMADDVMAAVYSNIALRLLVTYAPLDWFTGP